MKKTLHHRFLQRTKRRKAEARVIVMKGDTTAGISYTIKYSAPKSRKPYRPNEASQFGASEINIGDLNSVGMGWS